MRNLCFNCPYNKGLELGNGCGNDTCIQENMLFEKDEEPVHELPKKIVEDIKIQMGSISRILNKGDK